jgi:hypothetical protein
MMDRVPRASELTHPELMLLRAIVTRSFYPVRQLDPRLLARLLELELVHRGMGGVMPTPAGRIVSRM